MDKSAGFGLGYSKYLVFRRKSIGTNRFIAGSNYKFSRFHKGVLFNKRIRFRDYFRKSYFLGSHGTNLQFVVVSRKVINLTGVQMKSFKMLIKKPYKKLIGLNTAPYFGLTKKPAEVRMGKGKGSKVHMRVSRVYPGFSFGCGWRRFNTNITDFNFCFKFNLYRSKLPFRLSVLPGSF